MYQEITPAVRRAIASARAWAEASKSLAAEPRHLLLALLDEEEGRTAVLLRSQAIDLSSLRLQLAGSEEVMRAGLSLPRMETTDLVGFSHLLRTARRIALETAGEPVVATEHLLLALLEDHPDLQARLAAAGLNKAELFAQVMGPHGTTLPLDEPLELDAHTSQIDLARILDANGNRAGEAARVVEDFCRFVLDDACLCRTMKSLRHELAQQLASMPVVRLDARNAYGDVGTRISTATESDRRNVRQVAFVNLKRLQEALRALEEYGKLVSPDTARGFQQLRYRTYSLEKVLDLNIEARSRLAGVRLCVIVAATPRQASLEYVVKEAIAGGAEMIQLREKTLVDRMLVARARQVRQWTRDAGVLFIVNDRPDVSRLADADGVHLGQEDMTVKDARRIIGPGALIGVSTHNLDQLHRAIADGASYLGVGPTFASATKKFARLAGLDFVAQASTETSLPAFAIGGITPDNVAGVVAAGLRRVAVGHAVCAADRPRLAAAAIRQALG